VFGEGAGLAQCPALVTLFAPDGAGQKLARAFVEHFLTVLAREPLAQVPSRYAANGSVMTLMLAASGRATLSLVLFDGARLAERPAPQSAGFAQGERREPVIAGCGEGRLVHQSAGTIGESAQELMLALLGRMKRADAVPLMARMSGEGGESLRWQALRECLALDSGAGFRALCAIAADPGDVLAAPAGALRAQLLEAYSVLAGMLEAEDMPCPA